MSFYRAVRSADEADVATVCAAALGVPCPASSFVRITYSIPLFLEDRKSLAQIYRKSDDFFSLPSYNEEKKVIL